MPALCVKCPRGARAIELAGRFKKLTFALET